VAAEKARLESRSLSLPREIVPYQKQQSEPDKIDPFAFLFLDAVGQNSRFPSSLHSLHGVVIYCLLRGHVSPFSQTRFAGGWLLSH
jgi:hypothetical protein